MTLAICLENWPCPRWFSRETAAKYIAARLASCRQRKPKAGATPKSGGKPPHSKG